MSSQKAIAQKLSLNQSTVSRALKNDPRVNEATRQQVLDAALELGYRTNPLVATLMEQIRTGREVKDRGCLAIIVDSFSKEHWHEFDAFRQHSLGFTEQAQKRGYRTECFFLREKDMTDARLDEILYGRGIDGIFLAAPYWRANAAPFQIKWERYCLGTVGFSWSHIQVDRICGAHRRNADRCYLQLREQGYQRIGMVMTETGVDWANHAWTASSSLHQSQSTPVNRIPDFVYHARKDHSARLRKWMDQWQPDALICTGEEDAEFIHQNRANLTIIPVVLCSRPVESIYAGMDENNRIAGQKACDLVTSKIMHNERGLPKHPQTILIEGSWKEGNALKLNPATRS
jgi:LacI family transcriptional regulator